MKVMVDANILISAILFPQSIISEIVKHIIRNSKMILSKYTVDEVHKVFDRKFSHRINEMEIFMEKLPYELFSTKEISIKKYPNIRDIKDVPVLKDAIESNVDIFITGDNDFEDIKISIPKIMKPRKYFDDYVTR
ncbi:MAG: putative toxin-antitoxin system toxin component, PIN family [Treponema sp.]|nr:putative toxin-antitoxin system toxin component, PIN family [Treponema sp.]